VRKAANSPIALKAWGVLLTISTVLCAYFISYYVLLSVFKINYWLYQVLNVILMYTCIATKCLMDESMKVYVKINGENLESARKQLSYIVGRDTENLDESEITRGTVETVAENTSDGVIAPLLYMFIGGAPLALAYKAANTLDSMVGYKNNRFLYFGWASAKFDDLVNYIPARLTGILIVISSFILKLDYRNSMKIMLRDRKNHSSPNCGYPEAAAAGAMGVVLGGTNIYFGKPVYKPTMGDYKRPLNKEDIIIANRLMYASSIIFIFCASALLYFIKETI
jgi:adenosylcobinamide-phosphate synthase